MAIGRRSATRRKVAELPDTLREASRLHRAGRLEQAGRLYKKILESNPNHNEALHLLSLIEIQNNRIDNAHELITATLRVAPKNASVRLTAGMVCHRLGRLDEALARYDQALSLNPNFASAFNNRGNVLRDLARLGDAIANYDKALALKPDYPEALNNRGVALRDLKRPADALADFDKALVLRPNYADALNNRGAVLADLKRLDEAADSYGRALACDPGHAGALNNRGSVLRSLKQFPEALECLDRALSFEPANADAHNNRGNVLANLGRPTDALASYDQALALNPSHAEAYNNKGLLLAELGRFEEANEAIAMAIRLAPRAARFYFNLAEHKKFAAADPHIPAMEDLARDMPALGNDDQIDLHFALGKAYADLGRQSQSFRHLLDGNALKLKQVNYDEAAQLEIMDRMRRAFTPNVMRTHEGHGDASRAPVFIIGMPRSGSTLVEQILASHPDVFAAGEIDDFDKAVQELFRDTIAVSPESLATLPSAAWRDAGANYVQRLRRAAPEAARITNKKLNNFRIAGLIHLALPQARIIHIRRDPIDTCVSCFSKQFTDDLPYTYGLRELGRYYRAYESLMDHWRGVLPAHVMLEVQYEELVADLEGQARQVLTHCGLDWDPRCLDFHKAERPVRTASKAQVRQPLFQSSVGRWRAHEEFLGPLLAALDEQRGIPERSG